jgi:thiol:disulfide interchange protein DsbD
MQSSPQFSSRLRIAALCLAVSLPLWKNALAQEFEGQRIVTASLLSSTNAVVPGQPFDVGLLLEMAPGWHTYWEYSGDAGLPTRITWTLPEGFVAGPIQWPAPEAKLEPGNIQTYAYAGRVLLITTIVPAPGLKPGGNITIQAQAKWLVCKDLCIPGSASLDLTLPAATQGSPANAELFDAFRAQLPSANPPPFQTDWTRTGDQLTLKVSGAPPGSPIALFPLPATDQEIGHPQAAGTDTIRITAKGPFRGVLAVGEGPSRRAWFVENTGTQKTPATGQPRTRTGLWTALLYGFLGGLILNLMPCVLPVISLKIFGFIRQAGDEPRKILAHGLAFMAGIFAWFLGLAAIVIALRAGGSEVTWAFQFQNPWFNVAIGSLVFVFALNLFGVFEIVLPGRAATALEATGSTGGLGGSFFQGVFATLLATPCTAPFLGTALGFAFSQSGLVIVAMFASVATGMALPYLLLSAQPGWMKFLPRPGAWMEKMKQLMGFPLMATLVWLLSILGGQLGVEGILFFSAFLLCLAFACWLYGTFCGPLSSLRARAIAIFLAVVAVAGGGWYFLGEKFAQSGRPAANAIDWVPFSTAELDRLRGAGKTVFVDFTADWCITCKFNERTAINTPAVRDLLASTGVVPMKADWTNANPEITAALKQFGRVGVPLYVIYPPTGAGEPVVLPELLTEAIVIQALKNLP